MHIHGNPSACGNMLQRPLSPRRQVFRPAPLLWTHKISMYILLIPGALICHLVRESLVKSKLEKSISTTSVLLQECVATLNIVKLQQRRGCGSVAQLSCCTTWCGFWGCKWVLIDIDNCVHPCLSCRKSYRNKSNFCFYIFWLTTRLYSRQNGLQESKHAFPL